MNKLKNHFKKYLYKKIMNIKVLKLQYIKVFKK